MDKKEKEGRVKKVTRQGAFIEVIDKDGKSVEYFAHLGDIRQNEEILYNLRDNRFSDLDSIKKQFVKLELGETVKFKGWDANENNKPHAFNVEKK